MSEKRELTRAEHVRARRIQQVRQAMTHPVQRSAKALNPITTRVGSSYAHPQQKRAAGGRRFGIALGLPNIALRAPSLNIRRERGGWRPISFLLSLLLSGLLYLMWTQPYFHIPSVTVFGNDRLSREEIEAVLGLNGESVFMVQPQDAATRLRLNYPELSSAQVKVFLPNHVYVKVTERQPVIRWQQGDGFTWIDSSGVAFRPRGELNGLVSVTGLANPPAGIGSADDALSPPPFMDEDLVSAILALAPYVPAGSTLTFDPGQGLGWKDLRGWSVVFGSTAKDMPLKISVYQTLVDSLVAKAVAPDYINVTYAEAPFYRMNDTGGFDSTNGSQP